MELTTVDRKPVRRAFKTEPKVTTGIDAMAAIELEINRLKRLFSVASFILAKQDVQALSHFSSIHAQLKIKVMNHFQKLKSISIGIRKPAKYKTLLGTTKSLSLL
jgi:hypothetical protein